jgi:hypothetical protein
MTEHDLPMPIDDYERVLVAGEELIAKVRARQAEALTALASVEVHHMDGCRSMIEWTAARLDIEHDTARRLVRFAEARLAHPNVASGLEDGEITFDRALATAELAATGADDATLEWSEGFDLCGVHRLASRRRRTTRRTEFRVFLDRFVAIQPSLDESCGRLWGELPGFELRIVEKALRQRGDQFNDLPGPTLATGQRMADALVSIAQDSFDGGDAEQTTTTSGTDPLVTVFVDARLAGPTGGEAGAEIAYGPSVGPATLERILCTGAVQVVGLDHGRPVVTSDAARAIPPAVRRFVAWRDGGCTIAGCRSRYRLQPHHIRQRSHGGTHDPDNLTTLCWYHHHVVIHGMGHRIDPDSPPQCRQLQPTGRGPDPP